MSSELAIRVRDLGKVYRIYRKPADRLKQMLLRRRQYFEEYWALRGVDIEIARGEAIGIVGRNGSGKSTFLQLVCGTMSPTIGTVETNGRVAALLELGAGFNPEFTGRENVYLAATILGLSREEIAERLQDILDFAGIGEFIDQPVKIYSSGMYARLAFAVVAHVQPDILIVDEILAVGDAAFVQKCMRFIHKFSEQGTLLFVSHDPNAVLTLCERALWLDRGTVRRFGKAKDICEEYMAALHVEGDDAGGFHFGGTRKRIAPATIISDERAEFLKKSTLRNDIEVFDFDPNAPWFGAKGATIANVTLRAASGEQMPFLEGGEEVEIEIIAHVSTDLTQPIIGYLVKNHLGQAIFGDNTYISYNNVPHGVAAGQQLTAQFHFMMPYLASGDYSISVAIADGTQAEHTQHHWLDDALFFRVHASHVARGLCGVPMISVSLFSDGELIVPMQHRR
jgi:lipopolysaccharide transport system ATP-binding protein